MLYPVNLKWKNCPIWLEAESEEEAKGIEYIVSIGNPLLEEHENNNEPVNLKGQKNG